MMKKLIKVIAVLGLIFVIAISALFLFFPKEKVKNLIVAKAQQETNLPITLDDVGLKIFPRLSFELVGFEIGSADHMVHASFDAFYINANLMSFFRDEWLISLISIERPIIKLYTHNMDDDQTEEKIEVDTEEQELDLELSLKRFLLTQGEVWIFEQEDAPSFKMLGLEMDLSIDIDDQEFVVKGKTQTQSLWMKDSGLSSISLAVDKDLTIDTGQKSITLKKTSIFIQDMPLHLNGNIIQKSENVIHADIEILTQPTSLSSIFNVIPAIGKQAKQWNAKGMFSAQGFIQGDFDLENPVESFEKSNTELTMELDKASIQNKTYQVDFSQIALSTTITPAKAVLNKLLIQSDQTTIQAQGQALNYLHEPELALSLSGEASLKDLQPFIDQELIQDLQGNANFEMTYKGGTDLAQSDLGANVVISDALFFEPVMQYEISNFAAEIDVNTKNTTISSLQLNIKDSDFLISNITLPGYKELLDQGDTFSFSAKGHSDLINYSVLFPDAEEDEQGPLEFPEIFYTLKGSATYTVDTLLYAGAEFTDIQTTIRLDRGKVYLEPVNLNAFGGSVVLDGLVDLSPKTTFLFDLDLDAKKLQVQEALNFSTSIEELVQLKNSLTAKSSLSTKASGEMNNKLDLNIEKLNASGKVSFSDTLIKGHPIQNKLSQFFSTDTLKELKVKDWAQDFKIQNGKIHVENLRFSAQDFAFKINGYQSLDGTQNFAFNTTLPQSLKGAIESKVPKQLLGFIPKSSDGRYLLPLNITGAVTDPTVSIDDDQMQSDASSKAKEQIQKQTDKAKEETKKAIQSQSAPAKKEAQEQKEKVQEKAKEETKDLKKKLKKLF